MISTTALSASARLFYEEIMGDQDEKSLDPTTLASLVQILALMTRADTLADALASTGFIIDGSKGQPAAHPLLAEERHCRVQALQAIRSLSLMPTQSSASRAGAALAGRRWNKRLGPQRLASVSTITTDDVRAGIERRLGEDREVARCRS